MKKFVLALLLFIFLSHSEAQICHTLTVNSTSVLCHGNSTGSATVTAVGGTAPYTYTWSPSGGNTTTASGLAAGIYTVTVADAGTCVVTGTVNIAQPNFFLAVSTQTNLLCYDGVNFGIASFTTVGGTNPKTYTWSPYGGNALTATGLAPGTFTFFVNDGNNCTLTETVNITGPSFSLTATTAQTNNLCGSTNGRAAVIVAGGTTPYTYTWSPTGGNTATSSVLAGGIYTVNVLDANNCALSKTVNIIQSSQPTLTPNATNVSCNGLTNGSVSVLVNGGTPAYTYTWSPSGGNASTATGLGIGTYTVAVTDSYTCVSSATVAITQPLALSSTTAQTAILCNAGTGSASVTVSGGNGSYTYTWSPSGGNASSASGLVAGIYTVSITDASLCAGTRTFNLTQPTPIISSSTQTNVLCNGFATGAASVNASGGTGGYTYTWSPSGGNASGATGLTTGTYTVTIRDANNCPSTQIMTLTSPPPITGSVSSSPANCNNADGSASATASGGTGVLTYSWVPTGGVTATASAIGAGQYTCIVRDVNNCTLNLPVVVSPINPTLSLSASGTGICAGSSITLNAAGCNTYSWIPTINLSSPTGSVVVASPIVSTIYTVTGESIFGCTVTETLAVSVLPYPTLSLSVNATNLCSGTVVNFNATGALNYTWSPSADLNSAFISNPTSTLSSAVIYTVIGTNSLGCAGTETISISPLPAPTLSLSASSTSVTCAGETITLTALGATSFSWNVGGSASSIQVSLPASTLVSVTGTATNGCASTATLQVDLVPLPLISILSSSIVCKGATTILTATGAATYSWSNGTSGSSTPVTPTANTTYSVVGFDPNGCNSTASVELAIYLTPTVTILGNNEVCRNDKITLTASGGSTYTWSTGESSTSITYAFNSNTVISVSSSTANCAPGTGSISIKVNAIPTLSLPITSTVINAGQSVQITANSNGTLYAWLPAENLSCNKCSNPIAKPSVTTVYTVEVTNENGCRKTETLSIQVENACPEPFAPTAFSPDEDGNNDTWCIYSNCITDLSGEVFNRWGQKVFTITGLNQCWDGKLNGTPQTAGVFIFQAKATLTTGETKLLKGNFTLIK